MSKMRSNQAIVFLFNYERVVSEVIELAILKISDSLGIPARKVHAKVELEGDRIKPSFGIDSGEWEVDPERIKSVIESVWGELRIELSNRLRGVEDCRHDHRN